MPIKLYHGCIKKRDFALYGSASLATSSRFQVYNLQSSMVSFFKLLRMPTSLFFFFLYTCRPFRDGFESPGGGQGLFWEWVCMFSPLPMRFHGAERLFQGGPRGNQAPESTRASAIGKTSAQNIESGFQMYQWFNLIYYSPSWAPANPAALLESCSRSPSVWYYWSSPGKEAQRLSISVTFMS